MGVPVAEALPPGCAGSARFLQKQSQLLVRLTWTGMDLDWSLTKIGSEGADIIMNRKKEGTN